MPINDKLLVLSMNYIGAVKLVVWVATICKQVQRLVCVLVVSWPTIAPLGGKKSISSVLSISE